MTKLPLYLTKNYPFRQNYFNTTQTVKNIKINFNLNYIDEYEDINNPVLLMLHGNPTWSFFYRNLIAHYKKNYRVIVPDHLGCGLSDKPNIRDLYTLENHVLRLNSLINFLNLKNITLILHDWGGAIGMGYAVQNYGNIKNIVILNTAAFHLNKIPRSINFCKTPIIGNFLIRKFNAFAYPATFMAVTKLLSRDIKKSYLFPYDNYKNRIATSEFVQDIPLNETHRTYAYLKNIENNLHKILATTKKIIIWGQQDFCFTKDFFDKWVSIYPDAETYLIADAGHYVLEDANTEVQLRLDNFLLES